MTSADRTLSPTFLTPLAERYLAAGGPWDVPSLEVLLRDAPARDDLLVDGPTRLGSAELAARAAVVAHRLASRGVVRGRAVAWQLPNGWPAVVLYRACWVLGAVAVPLHHRFGEAEVAAVVGRVDPAVVVAEAGLPAAERGDAVEAAELVADHDGPGHEGIDAEPGDVAAVLLTSGSSGTPKGVVHTHRTLAAKARQMGPVHGLGPDDAVLMPAPLAHVSGLLNGLLVPGVTGMKAVVQRHWEPEAALGLIEAERVSFMVGPPTFFLGLAGTPGFRPERVASLRLLSVGGAGVTPTFVADAATTLGARVKRTYGSTEAPTVTTSTVGDDAHRAAWTDGRATGATELRVVDPDGGGDRPNGDEGEVWVRGPEVCAGYLDASATAERFTPDGWFRTGDLGRLDGEGWLTITGRLSEVIIRAGENIAAAEVEAALEAHPAVRQAVAVGYPDPTVGERVAAVVVADEGFDLEACRAWFVGRGIARYKTPERVVHVAAVPTLPSGKPDRRALAAVVAAR